MPLPEAGSSSTPTSSASSAPSSSSSSSASSCAAELWRADGQELRPASPRRRPPPLLPSPSLNAPSPASMATLYRTPTTPLDAEHDLGLLAAKLGDGLGNDVGLLPAKLGDGEKDLFLTAGKVGGALGSNASAAAPTSGKVLPSIALSAQASAGRGASRVSKRRSRASNKPPITVLSADTSNFRAMVQKLTGVPASAAGLPPSPFPPTNNGFSLHHHSLWGGAASQLPPSLLMKAQLPPGMPTIDTSSPFLPFLGPCQHPAAAAAAAAAASHFMHPGVKAPAFPNNGGSSPYGAAMANLKSLLMSSSAGSFGPLPASGTTSSLGDSIANAASSSSSSPLSSTFGYTSTAAPPSACASMAKLWDPAEGADRWARGSTLTSMVSDANADACERRQQQFQQQQQPPLPPDHPTLAGAGHVSNTLSEQALNLESLLMEDDSFSPHKAYPWISCDGPSLINSSSSLAPSKMEMAKLT